MTISISELKNDESSLEKLVLDYQRLTLQEEQRENEGHLGGGFIEGAINAIDDPMVIYDNKGKLCFHNLAFGKVLDTHNLEIPYGLTYKELIETMADANKYFENDTIKEAWKTQQIDVYNKALETGETLEIKRWDGEYYRTLVKRTPCGHIIDIRTNITAEKTRELVLSTVLDTTNQGILFLDPDGCIEHVNTAYKKLLEYEDFDFQPGATIEDLWEYTRSNGMLAGRYENDADWKKITAKLYNVLEEGKHAPQNVQIGHKHFELITRELDDGSTMHCIFDISELQEKKKELQAETVKAHAAERAKSEFLANMSHEIRTPMNGVMGMTELLMATKLDNRQFMFADTILRSGESLLTIINDILDFSKIDAGQIELHSAPFDLREAIEDVVTLIAPRVAKKDIELAVRVSPDLPEMFIGDVGRIRQIVTNLVGNAVKFTDEGHVVVDVCGEIVEEKNEGLSAELVIRVEDTGVGIASEKCDIIFDKFSQIDASAARKHEGTGLGLSITSSLIELMGGRIKVESEEGVGSVFILYVSLPIHEGARRKPSIPVDVTGSRILIIDDNEVNRSILVEQTTSWGFDAKIASSGEKGLALMEAAGLLEEQFDLLILDYQMPGLTGADVVSLMHGNPDLVDIPIVMLTSVDQTQDGKAFQTLGIQAHVTKPARSSQLMETIVDVLQSVDNVDGGDEIDEQTLRQASIDQNIKILRTNINQVNDNDKDGAVFENVDILVAEDNEVNTIVFTQTLEQLDVDFMIAQNGLIAVEYFKLYNPQIILMDVSMPEMNGLDATLAIRELEKEKGTHTPIIGVTAHAMAGDREKCIDAGMDDYLPKPISPNKLVEMIEKWRAVQSVKNAG